MPRPNRIYKKLEDDVDDTIISSNDHDHDLEKEDAGGTIIDIEGEEESQQEETYIDSDSDSCDGPLVIRLNRPPKPVWSDESKKIKFKTGVIVVYKNNLTPIKVIGPGIKENTYELKASGSLNSFYEEGSKLKLAPCELIWYNHWEINDPYLKWQRQQKEKIVPIKKEKKVAKPVKPVKKSTKNVKKKAKVVVKKKIPKKKKK